LWESELLDHCSPDLGYSVQKAHIPTLPPTPSLPLYPVSTPKHVPSCPNSSRADLWAPLPPLPILSPTRSSVSVLWVAATVRLPHARLRRSPASMCLRQWRTALSRLADLPVALCPDGRPGVCGCAALYLLRCCCGPQVTAQPHAAAPWLACQVAHLAIEWDGLHKLDIGTRQRARNLQMYLMSAS